MKFGFSNFRERVSTSRKSLNVGSQTKNTDKSKVRSISFPESFPFFGHDFFSFYQIAKAKKISFLCFELEKDVNEGRRKKEKEKNEENFPTPSDFLSMRDVF